MKVHALHAMLGASLLLLAGCAPARYAVKAPDPSNVPYTSASTATTNLGIKHQQTGATPFMTGRLPASLDYAGKPLEPATYLEQSLQAEFAARGVPITVSSDASAFPRLDVASFRMTNWRTNAYTPFITFTSLSTDLETAHGPQADRGVRQARQGAGLVVRRTRRADVERTALRRRQGTCEQGRA